MPYVYIFRIPFHLHVTDAMHVQFYCVYKNVYSYDYYLALAC